MPSEPLTKDESKLALGIVAGFLVLALVIGIWGVSRIGSNTDLGLDGRRPRDPHDDRRAPRRAPPPASGSAPAGGAGEPLAILKVEAYDPEGDGEENNSATPKIYDGDKSTGWSSENYRSNEFGGLKDGLGVIVDLGPNKKPQSRRARHAPGAPTSRSTSGPTTASRAPRRSARRRRPTAP